MLKLINLKEGSPSVDYALAVVEIEIENAQREGISAIKVLHGYGSHGRGGMILTELRKMLKVMQKQHKIGGYFGGDDWNIFNEKTLAILNRDKSIAGDEDLNKANPGITIIII